MTKVLELIDGGFIGGGQTHILSVAKNLDRTKFSSIIAASDNGPFKEEAAKAGQEFAAVNLPKVFRTRHLGALDKIVTENDIGIIHSHGGVAGMYARFYKKRFNKVKVIHTIHGIHYTRTNNFFRKLFSQSIEEHLVPYTDKFICVSEGDYVSASNMKIIDPTKTVVIKNGIDLKRFSDLKKDESVMKDLGVTDTDVIIGNISRFDFQKNQRMLIKAFIELSGKHPNAKLLLVGDGQFLNNCKEQVKQAGLEDKVIFTGEIANVESYYPLMDVFVFPSLWEGLSITLIEAMASGRPIIASDIPSNHELLTDSGNGIFFDLHDLNDLVKKIDLLIENKPERERLSENAQISSGDYNEKEMTRKIEKLYEDIFIED
jgi:glycosyltransferase involved in cell wall biosynthesis